MFTRRDFLHLNKLARLIANTVRNLYRTCDSSGERISSAHCLSSSRQPRIYVTATMQSKTPLQR
jgi:hypothetical protein